jgi:hypothetical protein
VVWGDGVCAFNPVYAQGTSVAALSAIAIDRCLREQRHIRPTDDLHGVTWRVQIQLAKVVAGPWQLASDIDRRSATTIGANPQSLATGLLQQYFDQVLHTSLSDATVAKAFTRVQHMIAAPTLLPRPAMMLRVLTPRLRLGQPSTPATGIKRPQLVSIGH